MKTRFITSGLLAVLLISVGSARAELPLIRLDRIFPLGGQAGSEVLLEISGKDFEDVKTLHFDHPGLKATLQKPNQFKVAIAANVPSGTYEVRAVGKYGISGAQIFQVSRGLTEFREMEPNDSPEKANKVAVNSAINGHSDGNGDDFFRFAAKKGQRIIIDCQGFRLNSTIRAILTLSTAEGKELLQSKPYYNRTDPLLDFVAPADGDYILRLHDMTFLGGLPYRLIISDLPQIENAFPSTIVPGEKTELTLLGRNLPGGKPAPAWTLNGQALEESKIWTTIPKDALLGQRFTFLNHLPSPSLNARGLQVWPPGWKNALNPVTLFLADAPVTLEKEPNDSSETAQPITLPTVIAGRFDKPGDADWFTFTGKAGDEWAIDLLCERLDFPGDPFVIVFDAKGNELATFDDHGINFNSLAQFNRDPIGTFRVPANGQYRIFVQERYRNGGPRYQYVLRLTKVAPDFYPVVFHETPSDPTCPVVWRGGSAFYEVCVNRRNFNGPVTIEAEGLPPGLSCPPVHVSPQGQFANIVFTASADAPAWSGAIRLKAWAMIDGKKIEREVRCSQRRWPIANINTSVVMREICLAIRDQAPYALKLPNEKLTVAAGRNLEFPLTVARYWPDFKGPVQITGLNLPPGFNMATVNILADKTEMKAKLTVAGNVPPGEYSVVVRGDAQVPFNRDAKAASRPNVRVADPSTAMTVVVTAAKKK
jgi:hypothetical protein